LLAERRPPARRDPNGANEPCRRPALQWQREYWDTFMRDEDQERKAVHYVESNPIKAKVCRLAEDWPFSSARFRDEFRRLQIPVGAPVSDPAC
jgi:hypothetical protein